MDAFATMITPFRSNGEVDLEAAIRYVDYYFENGLTGIFSVCQSGEIFFLSLEERVRLNKAVYSRAKELERQSGRGFTVVSSGHVSESLEDQVRELNAICDSGTDSLILITNRLDIHNEGDAVFLSNAERLLKHLPENVSLGLYECPYPYKRLVSPEILKWCISTGRFTYMKDTCCDIATLKERCELVRGSRLKILNANCQTLLKSMYDGADGYCGIMCNFHPRLYSALCEKFERDPKKAELIQSIIGTFGFIEAGLPYPLTAKYSMTLNGIPTELSARSIKSELMTEYAKHCVRQMKLATDLLEERLLGGDLK